MLRDHHPQRTEAEALAALVITHVTTLRFRGVISADAALEITAFINGRVAKGGAT